MYSTVLQKEILENIFLYEHRCVKLEYNFKFDFSPMGLEVIFNFFHLTFFLVSLQYYVCTSIPSNWERTCFYSSCWHPSGVHLPLPPTSPLLPTKELLLKAFFLFILSVHALSLSCVWFFETPRIFFLNFNWRLITLQYCSGCCHTLTWISHGCTCFPHPETPSHLPPHPIPQGHPSTPALSTLSHASNLDSWFTLQMIIYMFQCHSPKPSHPLPLPQSPKHCSIHLCLFCCLTYRVIVTIFLNSIYMC